MLMTDMESHQLSTIDLQKVTDAVQVLESKRHKFESFAQSLMNYFVNNPDLEGFIHFIKYRIKDQGSLRQKLAKIVRSDADNLVPDAESLAHMVTDYAGLRIVHLHMDQLTDAHPRILDTLSENKCELLRAPTAYVWDFEYDGLFKEIGVQTERRLSMYMTVHYDIVANFRTRITCELQVRSLIEELWGEVSHRVNYPHPSSSTACRDQLKVLARLASGCGRLVDSIFKSHSDGCAISTVGNRPV